jgi:hypothetical protein
VVEDIGDNNVPSMANNIFYHDGLV